MSHASQSGAAVNRRTVIIAQKQLSLPGVYRHAHPQRLCERPAFLRECELDRARPGQCI